jgi:hypothetical protein
MTGSRWVDLQIARGCGRDEALMRDYLDHPVRGGGTDYSYHEAWRHYRFAVA